MKIKLTEEGARYLDCLYCENLIDAMKLFHPKIDQELFITSLNYAGQLDEGFPENDFIQGALWERTRKSHK